MLITKIGIDFVGPKSHTDCHGLADLDFTALVDNF